MSKVRRQVLQCYYENKDVVNDRIAIISAVFRKSGWNDNLSLEENLERMPSPETITRAVRKLHEEGLIQYSDSELERRTEAFKQERDTHLKRGWFR